MNARIQSNCICRRVVPKNYFKHNHTYLLNNMTQILQMDKNSNVKYNIIQVKLYQEDIPN